MDTVRNSWTDDRLDDLNGKVDELGQRIDRRFESVDRRFEGIDHRLDALQRTMLQGAIGICAAMVTGFAGIATAIVASS